MAQCKCAFPGAQVYGPAHPDITPLTHHIVDDGAALYIKDLDLNIQAMATPGHTLSHVCYYAESLKALFCGDTLFSAGCGRLFEGSAEQMWHSLSRLKALPGDTQCRT